MKGTLLFLALILGFQSFAQKVNVELKKKYFGTYAGTISSFQLDTGTDLVEVGSERIQITIQQDSVLFQIGRNKLKGPYSVLFEVKKYYVLDCKIPGRLAQERVVVYKQGKKISRDGLFPQPSSTLTKVKE
ncbi:MAG: hypothetical protein V4638_10345 [Bacteroidota bacterium]